MAKQPGEDGSRRGMILSLLVDHSLLLHPDQLASIKNKLPAVTVGSLRDRTRAQAVLDAVETLLAENTQSTTVLTDLRECINDAIPLQPSKKHMNLCGLGNLEPAPSLKYQAAA